MCLHRKHEDHLMLSGFRADIVCVSVVCKWTAGFSLCIHFPSLVFRLHNDMIVESFNRDVSVLHEGHCKEQRIKFGKKKAIRSKR